MLGAGPLRRAREVTLPQLAPALSAAAALTFLFCFTSFGVILDPRRPGRATVETEIYNRAARLFDLQAAAALSLLQLAAVAVVLTVAGILEARAGGVPRSRTRATSSAGLVAGSVSRSPPCSPSRRRAPLPARRSRRIGRSAAGARSSRRRPRSSSSRGRPPSSPFAFASVAAAIALAVGGLAASPSHGVPPASSTARAPPPRRLSRDARLRVPDRVRRIPARLQVVVVARSRRPVADRGAVRGPHRHARATVDRPGVARSRGDARLVCTRCRREIDLPLVGRAFAVAAGFAFAIALGEFGATVFVARAEQPTLPVAIFRFLGRPGEPNQGVAAALAVVLAAIAVAAAVIAERLRTGAGGRSDGPRCRSRMRGSSSAATPRSRGRAGRRRGETVAVLGPSGGGKSTLLRAIAGLQRLDAGTVTLDGRDLAGVPPHRRRIGLMFQDDALFPHRDVAANIAFGLRMQGADRRNRARVTELLTLVGLEGRERRAVDRSPVASESASHSRVHSHRRHGCSCSTSRSERSTGRCTTGSSRSYAACSTRSARPLSTSRTTWPSRSRRLRVAVIRTGRIIQVATPEHLWAAPADAWVARFIGLENVDSRGADLDRDPARGSRLPRRPEGERRGGGPA